MAAQLCAWRVLTLHTVLQLDAYASAVGHLIAVGHVITWKVPADELIGHGCQCHLSGSCWLQQQGHVASRTMETPRCCD